VLTVISHALQKRNTLQESSRRDAYSAVMRASRAILLVALGLLAVAAIRDVAHLGDALPWRQLYDFADFYCAGDALDRGADPYRYEPLHACEHRVSGNAALRADAARVVPAPLPPYDFPPFMLAARLGFPTARAIDAVAIVLAVVVAVWGLSLVAISLDVAALALLLPAGFVLLNAGQVVPFALVALVFCGVALARRRERAAGILAALTLVEPHLGLPVCVAVLWWARRARSGLVATAFVLGVLGILTIGVAGTAEYLARVLPAQAAAETAYVYQYSLTYLLRTIGASAAGALAAGQFSYVGMVVLGVWLSQRVAARLERPELVAYLPAAFSVIAGPYVHMVDLAVAVPAALVLVTASHGAARNLAVVTVCLLAVPWIPVWITKKLFLAALFVVAALLVRVRADRAVSIAAFASIAVAIYLLELVPPAPFLAATPGAFTPSDLAQAAWSAYVAALGPQSTTWLVVKLPTWAALLGIIGASFAALHEERATAPA
jgi:hypothetical protein